MPSGRRLPTCAEGGSMVTSFSAVGKSAGLSNGPEKVTGEAVFGVDVTRPGMLWGKILRSDRPHARIVNIDTSRAESMAGVFAVITANDLPSTLVGRSIRDAPVLVRDRVLFVGDRVAAVAAESPDIAMEALNRIDVEYEDLPGVFDPLEAMKAGAPILHPDLNSYEGLPEPFLAPTNVFEVTHRSHGDVDRGFVESDLVFEHTFTTQLMHQGYMEPHGCLVEIDDSGRVQIWATNKSPYNLKRQLALVADLPQDRIVVHPTFIGGDYGGKGSFMDGPICYHLARVSGRPVKMLMSYYEELLAANPRHAGVITVKTGVKKDGRMWARRTEMVFNAGAYGGYTPTLGLTGVRFAGGCYRIPHMHLIAHMVYTNGVPCGHMRAPGEASILFALESHLDMIAKEMGWDPYEFRAKNVIHSDEAYLYEGLNPVGYKEVKGEETLKKAAAAAHWDQPLAGGGKVVGRGMSLAQRAPGTGITNAVITVDGQGHVALLTAVLDTGTGSQVVLRQIVAEELSIPVEEVVLKELDTDAFEDDSGVGAGRVLHMAGGATLDAAQEMKDKLKGLAADLLECPEEEVVLEQGRVTRRGHPESGMSLADLAAKAVTASGQELKTESHPDRRHPKYNSFCVQIAEVEVDTETGQVHLRKLITTHDVGTILNPIGHQGQINGAFAMGVGYTFMEELVREDGHISTLNLADYKFPNIQDMPELATVLVGGGPGPLPYGGKGIGEASLSPVAPAVANAIADAIGVRIMDLPITAEKVLRALREKRSQGEP